MGQYATEKYKITSGIVYTNVDFKQISINVSTYLQKQSSLLLRLHGDKEWVHQQDYPLVESAILCKPLYAIVYNQRPTVYF